MPMRNPKTTAKIGDHPIHPMLIPFPIAFLVATLVCDLIFWRSGNGAWSTAALWLLGAALIMAAAAAVMEVVDFARLYVARCRPVASERGRDCLRGWATAAL